MAKFGENIFFERIYIETLKHAPQRYWQQLSTYTQTDKQVFR